MKVSTWMVLGMGLAWVGQACGDSKSDNSGPTRILEASGAGNRMSGSGGTNTSIGGSAGMRATKGSGGSAGTGARGSGGDGNVPNLPGAGAGGRSGGTAAGEGGAEMGGAGAGGSGGLVCNAGEGGADSRDHFVCLPTLDAESCGELDCVADCASATVVRGEADGCGVRCPPAAPIPAQRCYQECDDGTRCGPGLYCTQAAKTGIVEFQEDCGNGGPCGCEAVPDSCPASGPGDWICARDGRAYPSRCDANRARTDMVAYDYEATCAAPAGELAPCGGVFCATDERCVIQSSDDHAPMSFSCDPIGGAGGEGGGAGAASH